MPTYQYLCQNCNHEFEELQLISEPPLTRCPNCSRESLVRVLGAGGGLIFKGSGFYLTDYKSGSKGSSSDGNKGTTSSAKKDESGTTPAASPSKPSKESESA